MLIGESDPSVNIHLSDESSEGWIQITTSNDERSQLIVRIKIDRSTKISTVILKGIPNGRRHCTFVRMCGNDRFIPSLETIDKDRPLEQRSNYTEITMDTMRFYNEIIGNECHSAPVLLRQRGECLCTGSNAIIEMSEHIHQDLTWNERIIATVTLRLSSTRSHPPSRLKNSSAVRWMLSKVRCCRIAQCIADDAGSQYSST